MSSSRDQKKYIDSLKRFERKMDKNELYIFQMLVKRIKDDEDLDSISFKKLSTLYEKYYTNRPKKSLDNLFKK